MWKWAYRSFLDERASLAASASGVAVVFLLVMILEGAFKGEADQTVAFIEHSDASIWVMQKGVANMHMASSALTEDVVVKLQRVPASRASRGSFTAGAWPKSARTSGSSISWAYDRGRGRGRGSSVRVEGYRGVGRWSCLRCLRTEATWGLAQTS